MTQQARECFWRTLGVGCGGSFGGGGEASGDQPEQLLDGQRQDADSTSATPPPSATRTAAKPSTTTSLAGADRFVMAAHSGYDHILDGQDGVDHIAPRQLHGVPGITDLILRTCDGNAFVAHGDMLARFLNAASVIDASDFLFAA